MLSGFPLRTAVRYDSSLMLNVALLMGAPRNAADDDGQGLHRRVAAHASHDRHVDRERHVADPVTDVGDGVADEVQPELAPA